MKKAITLLLLASMLTSIAACASTSPSGSDTTAPDSAADTTAEAVTTEPEPVPDLPEKRYDGYTFTFYTRDKGTVNQYAEEESGDTMNDAVYKRNQKISEQYGVTFAVASDGTGTGAKDSILAGEDAYDVIMPHGRYAFNTYAVDGLCLNWHTDLPYVDMDQPWWSQDARDSFTVCDKLFAMVGDISWQSLASTKVMYFNKNLFDEYNWDYPYQTILDGDWTYDEFLKLATDGAKDLNGDTKFDIENDQMGFATTWWGTPINILFTADQRIADKNADNELVITVNTERSIEVYEKFFASMEQDGMYLHMADDVSVNTNAFRAGRMVFYEATLEEAASLRDMNDEFGIIPCPKFDDTVDEYITGVDASTGLAIVPVTASDTERTSIILEALAYEGWKTVTPAYYDVALSVKYARDEESVQMLDIIRESRIYDVGYYINIPTAINSIGWMLCKREDHNFTSYYAENEEKALARVETINAAYRGE